MNPFDFVNSITNTKQHLMEQDPFAEKEYVAYLTNHSLSNFADTIFAANAMNTNHLLDRRMQYDYLFYGVTKKRRYSKWHKPKYDNRIEIDAIKAVFGYSEKKAQQAFETLKPEDVQKILKEWQHMNGK
jgi:hypothetical protein